MKKEARNVFEIYGTWLMCNDAYMAHWQYRGGISWASHFSSSSLFLLVYLAVVVYEHGRLVVLKESQRGFFIGPSCKGIIAGWERTPNTILL